jgi:hypothetical protein
MPTWGCCVTSQRNELAAVHCCPQRYTNLRGCAMLAPTWVWVRLAPANVRNREAVAAARLQGEQAPVQSEYPSAT